MATLFDAYLMVDWSASSRPKHGKDSIWYCLRERKDKGSSVREDICLLANPLTRQQAITEIESILAGLAAVRRRVLVGFDFPFGYPRGLCEALGLEAERGQMWRAIWREWTRIVGDEPDNRNSRFGAAAALNERLPPPPGPFWGQPTGCPVVGVSSKKPVWNKLAERRLVETLVPTTQPVWKLAGVGSVGSQALLGIPRLEHLRSHPGLAAMSRVWPFEWEAQTKKALLKHQLLVLYVEIYPSLISGRQGCEIDASARLAAGAVTDPPVVLAEGKNIKDAAQMYAAARFFRTADKNGELEALLDQPLKLPEEQRRAVIEEEGWILGVGGT